MLSGTLNDKTMDDKLFVWLKKINPSVDWNIGWKVWTLLVFNHPIKII